MPNRTDCPMCGFNFEVARPKLTDLPLTGWDLEQAVAVVWAALERLDLPEDEQDHLNTAMAWITEATEDYPG